MVRILRLALFSIALSVTVSGTALIAQTPESFYIGTFGFSPEWDENVHLTHFIEGVLSDPVGNQRLHFLGDTIFARARELGLNLIGTVVHPDSVATTIESNVVHEICDAAAPGGSLPDLGVAVLDFGILEKLAGERIMLHPESELDFTERGEYEPQGGQQFENLPIDTARLAAPLTIANPANRCVLIEADKGEISGVVELRKRDLSMYRAWRDADNNREDEGISGLYIVSVTVQAIEPGSFNENPTPLMNLDIMTVDSTHNTPGRTIRFQLLESDFFDTAHQAISTPIEVVLGEIEIRQTAQGVVFVDERRANNTAWTDTILTKSVNVITREQYWNPDSVSAKLDSLDIRLSYAES